MKRFFPIGAFLLVLVAIAYAANEQNNSFGISYNKGGDSVTINETKAVTVSGTIRRDLTLSIPTNDPGTQIDFGAVTSPGWCYVKNLDTNNAIYGGPASGTFGWKLNASEGFPFRAMETNLWLKATNAACTVRILILPN